MQPELLIFDLDGTLVDTSESVVSAVRRTLQNYLSHFLGIRGSGSLVSEPEVRAFRQAGFRDPVEQSAALIRYFLSLLPGSYHPGRPAASSAEGAAFLKKASAPLRGLTIEQLREQADVGALAERIQAAGGGREGLASVLGGWSHPLLLDEGPLDSSNLVRRLYQEIYLGNNHFGRMERAYPRFYRGTGLIESENLRFDLGSLERLHGTFRGRMAVLTEREAPEAQLLLGMLKLDRLFDAVVTHEDVTAEEARERRRSGTARSLLKPDPYLLLEAAERLDYGGTRPALYLGSTPAGIEAATAADGAGERPVAGWGLMPIGVEREQAAAELEAAGAARLFAEPREIVAELLDGA